MLLPGEATCPERTGRHPSADRDMKAFWTIFISVCVSVKDVEGPHP